MTCGGLCTSSLPCRRGRPLTARDSGVDLNNAPIVEVSAIEAQDEDTIIVTAEGNTLRLVVDGEGPVVSDTTPRNGTLQSSASVNIGFTVTDSGSGLRTDAEDPTTNYATSISGAPAPVTANGGTVQPAGDGPDVDGILNEPLAGDQRGRQRRHPHELGRP